MNRTVAGCCLAAALQVGAVPPPTEYTMAMLTDDLHGARLVALVEVQSVDTTSEQDMELTTLLVLQTYKGGLSAAESTLVVKRNRALVGGYAPDYRVGEQSFLCIGDSWRDGVVASANARGKFDVVVDSLDTTDYVRPPPVGYGFSDEFSYSTTFTGFSRLLLETVRTNEFLSVCPLLPRAGAPVVFGTSIDLSGGATLDHVSAQVLASTNRVAMELIYTPCTGVCPYIYLVQDTSAALDSLAAGSWTATRHKYDSRINAPFVPADDSVSFTVYAVTATVQPATHRVHRTPVGGTGDREGAVDLRGRTALPLSTGVRIDGATGRVLVR